MLNAAVEVLELALEDDTCVHTRAHTQSWAHETARGSQEIHANDANLVDAWMTQMALTRSASPAMVR
jgi:hypothetical protein